MYGLTEEEHAHLLESFERMKQFANSKKTYTVRPMYSSDPQFPPYQIRPVRMIDEVIELQVTKASDRQPLGRKFTIDIQEFTSLKFEQV